MSANGRRRVVVTGLGAVTPLGNGVEPTWQSLLAGESAATNITRFDPSAYATHFACQAEDFEPTEWIERKTARRMDRFAQMIVSAAGQAEQDSGVVIAPEPDRVGVPVATGIGGLSAHQDYYENLLERGPDRGKT